MNFPVSSRRALAMRTGPDRLMVTMKSASAAAGWGAGAGDQKEMQTHQQIPALSDPTHKDLRGS